MTRYIVKRIIMIIPIILAIILVLFILQYLLTASNIRQMTINGDGDALDPVYSFLNVTDNFFTKYVRYCYNVLVHLDFGKSSGINIKLTRELSYRVRNTLWILGCGVGATLAFGIPIGVYTAVHKNSKRDRIINAVTLFFSAIPSYSLAMVITLILAVYLRLLPVVSSYYTPKAYLMPTLTIAFGGISLIARTTRTSMLEVLEQPYITALRSKGLKDSQVVYRHAFKNALAPVVSVLGGVASQMLCGTFVVEQFYSIPGLGSYMLRSVSMREHMEILGCTVVIAIILSALNVVADIAYAFINPQIRLRYTKNAPRKGGAKWRAGR